MFKGPGSLIKQTNKQQTNKKYSQEDRQTDKQMINYLLPILFGWHLTAEIAGIMYDLQLSKYVDIWGTIHGYFVKK